MTPGFSHSGLLAMVVTSSLPQTWNLHVGKGERWESFRSVAHCGEAQMPVTAWTILDFTRLVFFVSLAARF